VKAGEPFLEHALELLVTRLAAELADRVVAQMAERAAAADAGGLSMADAAKRLNVSERTVRELIVRGELHSVKVGRRRLVSSAAVARLLAGEQRRSA
jgi:excisionase family DNA binding protein